jgi:hypothetical protein
MRMKACRDRNQTEDPTLHIEMAGIAVLSLLWVVMDLLVGGPGLVLCSVPRILPTRDSFELELLL